MKNILLIIGTVISLTSYCQISLDSSDFFSIGDTFTIIQANNPGSINVSGGANHIWDFSSLTVGNIVGTKARAIDPIKHKQDTLFPNAHMYVTEGSFGNSYLIKTPDSLMLDGSANFELIQGSFFDLNYNPDIKILEFPVNYNDQQTSITNIDTIIDTTIITFDKIRIEVEFALESEVEGWGTIKTVQGNYNTLKVYTMQAQGFDVFGHIPSLGWQTTAFLSQRDTSHIYRWFGKNHNYQIAEVLTDKKNGTPIEASFLLTDSLIAFISDSANPSCFGFSDGSAIVKAVGGTGNYTYLWDDPSTSQNKSVSNLNEGMYNVTVTDIASNNTANAQVNITNPDSLNIFIISMKDEGNTPNTGEIEVGVTGGTFPYNYNWNNSSSTTKLASNLSGGSHTVTVTDDNNCTSDTTIILGSTVGINDLITQEAIKVYPNPITDYVNISGLNNDITNIKVYDILGNLVFSDKNLESKTIDLSTLNSGNYILEVKTNHSFHTVRIEKQ